MPERGSTGDRPPPAPDAPAGEIYPSLRPVSKPRSHHPGRPRFSGPGGTGHGGSLPSTDDVGSVTGGLHSCSGPAGPGGSSCLGGTFSANPFFLTFLDSGGLLKFVCRFSGRAFLQGALGWLLRELSTIPSYPMSFPLRARYQPGSPSHLASGRPRWAIFRCLRQKPFRLLLEQCPAGRGRGPLGPASRSAHPPRWASQPLDLVLQFRPPSRSDGVSTAAAAAGGLPASAPLLEAPCSFEGNVLGIVAMRPQVLQVHLSGRYVAVIWVGVEASVKTASKVGG